MDPDFLRRLEALRSEIELWVRVEGVPAGDAPEWAQRVIHRAAEKQAKYDPSRPLEPWVRRIAQRMVAEERRNSRTRAALAFRLLVDDFDPSTPERQVLKVDVLRALAEAVATLDAETRALLEAHYWGGRSLKQLSEELGVPESTLTKRLYRARNAIREKLAERGITDGRLGLLPLALFRVVYDGDGGADAPPTSGPTVVQGENAEHGVSDDLGIPADRHNTIRPTVRATDDALAHVKRRPTFGQGLFLGSLLGLLFLPLSMCDRAQSRTLEVTVHHATRAAACGAMLLLQSPPEPPPKVEAPEAALAPPTRGPDVNERRAARQLLGKGAAAPSQPVDLRTQ